MGPLQDDPSFVANAHSFLLFSSSTPCCFSTSSGISILFSSGYSLNPFSNPSRAKVKFLVVVFVVKFPLLNTIGEQEPDWGLEEHPLVEELEERTRKVVPVLEESSSSSFLNEPSLLLLGTGWAIVECSIISHGGRLIRGLFIWRICGKGNILA